MGGDIGDSAKLQSLRLWSTMILLTLLIDRALWRSSVRYLVDGVDMAEDGTTDPMAYTEAFRGTSTFSSHIYDGSRDNDNQWLGQLVAFFDSGSNGTFKFAGQPQQLLPDEDPCDSIGRKLTINQCVRARARMARRDSSEISGTINGKGGPGTTVWENHEETFTNQQRGLRKQLGKWDNNNCSGNLSRLAASLRPTDARHLAVPEQLLFVPLPELLSESPLLVRGRFHSFVGFPRQYVPGPPPV